MPRTGIQLCYPMDEKRLAKWQPPYILQPKLDGERCRAVCAPDGSWKLLSSEENFFFGLPHLNKAIADLQLPPSTELDGELYVHGLSFNEIHSIVSREVNLHPNAARMEFHIFDVVNNDPQLKRTAWLTFELRKRLKPPLWVVESMICYNLDEVMFAYDSFVNLGYEGIIIRDQNAPYVRRRSTQVMKFKPKKDDHYTICGYSLEVDEKTDSEKPGVMGRFICAGSETTPIIIGDYPSKIDPPAGFFGVSARRKGTKNMLEEQRELWLTRESLLLKQLHVQYQHLTTGKNVPRFPVFVKVVEPSIKI